IASEVGAGTYHVRATRDADGHYALIYLPAGKPVEIDLTRLAGERLACFWYDPRTGAARDIGMREKQERASFAPPGGGPHWVLVLDDAASGFPAPGSVQYADRQ